jgi:integrase
MIVKDREAVIWRRAHSKELREQLAPFLAKAYRRSKSVGSSNQKYFAVAGACGWQKRLPNELLNELKTGGRDPYKFLDEYVTYLTGIGEAPFTTKNHVSGLKKWMTFNDVELSSDRLRDRLELPRQFTVTRDRVPTNQELRDVVYSADARGKALITLLSSSGMRVGEVLSLRVKDIDFSTSPIRVYLRPEITKDRQERYVFASDEAKTFLMTFLGDRMNEKDAYVFQGRTQGTKSDGTRFPRGKWENKPMTYWNADFILTTALKKAGIYEKDDHGRDTIHIHCLRKFFFTRLVSVIGREVTEALMGHKQFLDSSYRRFTLDELAAEYLKGMDALSIKKGKTESPEIASLRTLVEGYLLDLADDRARVFLSKKLGIEQIDPETWLDASKRDLWVSLMKKKLGIPEDEPMLIPEQTLNYPPRQGPQHLRIRGKAADPKVIAEDELETYLADGWRVQTTLPSGKILIEK